MGDATAGDCLNTEEAFQEQRLGPGVKSEDERSGVEKPRRKEASKPRKRDDSKSFPMVVAA